MIEPDADDSKLDADDLQELDADDFDDLDDFGAGPASSK